MSTPLTSDRSGVERAPLPLATSPQHRPAGTMTSNYWTVAAILALVVLAGAVALLGLTKTLILLAKVYVTIFVLLFLAAFLTGGGSGSRML